MVQARIKSQMYIFFKSDVFLELAVTIWTPGLTKGESYQIERVQKWSQHVILGDEYLSCEPTSNALGVEKLTDRRNKLCLNFAKRSEKHPKYSHWFNPAEVVTPPNSFTSNGQIVVQTKYTPVPYRTDRYRDPPIPFLTKLLNMDYAWRWMRIWIIYS